MNLPVNYEQLKPYEKRMVREEYIKLQNGLCFYCGADLKGPPEKNIMSKKVNPRLYPESFFKHPVHLHHDHNSGLTIGAVHCHCNAVLWEYEGK